MDLSVVKPRRRDSHKGDYGHALLVAGSLGMAGASVLASRAALRSGLGLLTVHVPKCNNVILQTAIPEAMTYIDACETHFSVAPDVARYGVVGVGPGLGRNSDTAKALLNLIERCNVPMVIDADALNIISEHKEWMKKLPKGSVITPHPGEFARLAGASMSREEALQKASGMAREYGICVVLKGAPTAVVSPNGEVFFNNTGNPGMATAGSGDVLTGVLLATMARITDVVEAARLAAYVHGFAGDLAADALSETAMISGDIVEYLPAAWRSIELK